MAKQLTGMVLGIDAGGTKIKVALSRDGVILGESEFPTLSHLGAAQCFDRILSEADTLIQKFDASLDAVGLASPGVVHPASKTTEFTWNIAGWDELGVASRLRDKYQVPVAIENDANMAAIGESLYGNHGPSFAFFAIGTGFGAGLILYHQIWRGKQGAGGEIAKWYMAPDAVKTEFNYGHLEYLMSGSGFEKRYQEETGQAATGKEIFRLMESGDPVATRLLEEGATALGMAAANVSNLLDLDAVVLGGGVVTSNPSFWMCRVQKIVSSSCIYPPQIRLSVLDNNAVLMGAIVEAHSMIAGGIHS